MLSNHNSSQPLRTCALGVCANAQHTLVVGLRVHKAAGTAAAAGGAPGEALPHHLQALSGTPASTATRYLMLHAC
jgi:hypothetical protein